MMAADARATMPQAAGQVHGSDSCFAADPAADMWCLGLVAWHVFTGQALFGKAFSDEQVINILLGYSPLPFESDPSMWCLFNDSQVRPAAATCGSCFLLLLSCLHGYADIWSPPCKTSMLLHH